MKYQTVRYNIWHLATLRLAEGRSVVFRGEDIYCQKGGCLLLEDRLANGSLPGVCPLLWGPLLREGHPSPEIIRHHRASVAGALGCRLSVTGGCLLPLIWSFIAGVRLSQECVPCLRIPLPTSILRFSVSVARSLSKELQHWDIKCNGKLQKVHIGGFR